MANYPQLDNASGVWNLREVYDAVMGGYWPNAGAVALTNKSDASTKTVDKTIMSTSGNATNFGDLLQAKNQNAAFSSFTRSVFAGGGTISGEPSTHREQIDYFTFTTEGNAADFGNLTVARGLCGGFSNTTRGIITGGQGSSPYPALNTIDYVTIDSTGNATDFGDLTTAGLRFSGTASPTRGLNAGGQTPGNSNVINFVEIATTGDATDFGDLTQTTRRPGGASSSTRATFAGGENPSFVSTIQFVTISSQGNGTDFGDLTAVKVNGSQTSNSVKGFYFGGNNPSDQLNNIDQYLINTGGTATDFGDTTITTTDQYSNSQSHGGLNDGYQGTRPLPYADNGDRAVFGAGTDPGLAEQVSFIKISSTGNDGIFGGYLNGAPGTGNYKYASAGGNTRGLGGGGYNDPGTVQSETKYLTFSTKGNMAVFGDLSVARQGSAACSNSIRSVVAGGSTPSRSNVIDYFTTASIGNAADFGDLNMGTSASLHMSGGNHTRGIFAGGNPSPGSLTNAIDFITFSTVGNSTDFGDLTVGRSTGSFGQMCSATRSVFAGGLTPSASDVIDYVTTATTGNATDFGNLAAATSNSAAASSTTRAVIAGGATPSIINTIQFVTIASTSNTSDFGDLSEARHQFSGMSDAHGGLQGG